MAHVRSSEDIRRKMEFANNPTGREEAKTVRNDDAKRSSVGTLNVPACFDDKIPGIDQLPDVLQYLCLAYADYLPEEKVIYQYPTGTFFTRYVSQIQYRLEKAADNLLNGNIDMALALIKANKEIINIPTQGRNRFGTCIQKMTLLQMAAVAGDVNLRDRTPEEKEDHGALELLAQAGGLSKDEIANQLFEVLFSEDAKRESQRRKQRVLDLVIEFAKSILKKKAVLPKTWSTIDELWAAQATCLYEINKLRNDLIQTVSNEIITLGFILDSQIFVDVTEWFKKNFNDFGSWWSLTNDLFWINGYGSLQYVVAARDAQVLNAGIRDVAEENVIPLRSFNNSDGSSHFAPSSKLGIGFFFGYGGRARGFWDSAALFGDLMSRKNARIEKFMQCPDSSALKKRRWCVVM